MTCRPTCYRILCVFVWLLQCTLNILQSLSQGTCYRHPIAFPWGQDMGWFSWILYLNEVYNLTVVLCTISCYISPWESIVQCLIHWHDNVTIIRKIWDYVYSILEYKVISIKSLFQSKKHYWGRMIAVLGECMETSVENSKDQATIGHPFPPISRHLNTIYNASVWHLNTNYIWLHYSW